MTADQKTIFIVVHSGFGARYLLRTEILRTLEAAGVRTVILTPNADEAYFRQEFEAENVFVEKLEFERCRAYRYGSKIQPFLQAARQLAFNRGQEVSSMKERHRIHRESFERQSLKGKLVFASMNLVVEALSRSRWLRRALIAAESRVFPGHFHRALFEKYRPDLVVTTSLGYWHPDDYVMREAQAHGAGVVPVILSWDNTSSKGMAGAHFDHAIAWTEIMKQELVDYHDADPARIFVGGIAHFDLYHHPGALMSRDALFEQLGLSPDRKLVLFATKSPNTYPWNPEIARLLAEAIASGRVAERCHLVVRLHPIHFRYREGELVFREDVEAYQALKAEFPFVHIDVPEILSETLSLDMPWSDMVRLGSLLRHADVLVNSFSTVAIEASIFDLPIIHIAFEGDPAKKTNPRHHIQQDEVEIHNQRVVQTGGVRLAHTPEALVEEINRYLADPSLEAGGRRQIVRQECGPNPGCAGVTIGEHLVRLLQEIR